MATAHELRRWLVHGLRLGAAGVTAACQGRAGVGDARPLAPGTVLAETALLCRVAGRLLADEPCLARLEGIGAAQARLGGALTRALGPQRAALVVATDPRQRVRDLVPFALLGDLDTGHRAVARRLLGQGLDAGPSEQSGAPDRLELGWLKGLVAGCPGAPPLPPGSVLEHGADLLPGELADAHALTRAVLHATDTGLAAPRTSRPAVAVSADAEALLGAALAAADLDVAAELLWTWPMLGLPVTPGARYALGELARAEESHGFLPGAGYDPAVAAGVPSTDRSTYVVQTSCHTAVVGGVLAAALLRAGAPASARPRTTPDHVTADPLPVLRLADGPWAEQLRDAVPAARAACAPLVLGAELRTAAAHRDPDRLHHVVAWAADHGWAHLPSVRQGAALITAIARASAEPATLAS